MSVHSTSSLSSSLLSSSSCSTAFQAPVASPPLDIVRIFPEEWYQFLKCLEEDTISTELLSQLTGQERHNDRIQYMKRCSSEITPGRLWMQKESGAMAIYWTEDSAKSVIYRATLYSKDAVNFETFTDGTNKYFSRHPNPYGYINHWLDPEWTSEIMLVNEFLEKTKAYLRRFVKEFSLKHLQEKLETLPIICKISQSAYEKITRIVKKSGTGLNIAFGNRLLTVTHYYFNRVVYFHKEKGYEKIAKTVMPVLNSTASYEKIKKARTETRINEKYQIPWGNNTFQECFNLSGERTVKNLSSLTSEEYQELAKVKFEKLNIYLVTEWFWEHSFQTRPSGSDKEGERLELSIDYKNEAWQLFSQYFTKA